MGSAFDFQGSCPARARGCGYWGGGGGVFAGFEDVLGVFLFLLFSSYVCVFCCTRYHALTVHSALSFFFQ